MTKFSTAKLLSQKIIAPVFDYPRWQKMLILGGMDIVLSLAALYLAYALRLNFNFPEQQFEMALPVFLILPLVNLGLIYFTNAYKISIRYVGRELLPAIGIVAVASSIVLAFVGYLAPSVFVPRSVPFIHGVLLFVMLSGARFAIQDLFERVEALVNTQVRVLVYGAGAAGHGLVRSLGSRSAYHVVGFVDDNPKLVGTIQFGRHVYDAADLAEVVKRLGISTVLIAIPSMSKRELGRLTDRVASYGVDVRVTPDLNDLLASQGGFESIGLVDPNEMLHRANVSADLALLRDAVSDKVVAVTGAAGSIGSEIARQILRYNPRKVLLVDHSEHGLYEIERELREAMASEGAEFELVTALCSVTSPDLLRLVFKRHDVNVIYHAAAYKHVPLAEQNRLATIRNNWGGTYHVCAIAAELGIGRVVLISTDKAVRPTSVMGVSKRLSEIVLRYWQEMAPGTIYSAVRFGNVLGSSGSVIPLFKDQIAKGGPVTVTDPDVYRYFMTIEEAAQLVIQSTTLASGGEIFLLDMGEEVRIVDLARRLITLSGFQVKDDDNPDGDIEIVFTGLRPGERLHEELLVVPGTKTTCHPKIMCSEEPPVNVEQVEIAISKIDNFISQQEADALTNFCFSLVETAGDPNSATLMPFRLQ